MMIWNDIARAVFPDASETELGVVIWECTGFPSFWKTDNPAKEMYHQLREARWRMQNGLPNLTEEEWAEFQDTV